MRIRHSLKAFVPFIMMLAAGRSASAQYGPPVPPQGSVPAGYQPYAPQSPYQSLFEQTYVSDGLWYNDATNGFGAWSRPRKFFMNLDYTRSTNRQMRGVFGHQGVQSYLQQNDPDNDEIVAGGAFYNYFNAAAPSMIPELMNNGMRGSAGFWNPDGTGLIADFSWQAEADSTFDARKNALAGRLDTATALALQASGGTTIAAPFNLNGQSDLGITMDQILAPGQPFDDTDSEEFGVFGSTFDVLDRTLLNLYGVPIDDGSLLGVTIPYDIQFLMQHRVSTMGTSIDFAFAPIYDRGGIRVNPVIGGRYYKLDEQFAFRGIDSGLSYSTNGDDDTPDNAKVFPVYNGIDDDNDFVTDNIAEEGTLDFSQVNPSDPILVRAYHDAQVVSNMSGPEFGFNYMLGEGDGITINGFTKIAAMFNNEKIKIRGDNLFNHMNVSTTVDPATGLAPLLDGYDTDNLNGPSQNAYASSNSSTHLSPLFEQSLTAEIPLFNRVPVLRNVRMLEDAKLRLGWSWLFIGEVADPVQSVIYQSNPQANLFPTIQADRGSFSQNTFSIGVNWNY